MGCCSSKPLDSPNSVLLERYDIGQLFLKHNIDVNITFFDEFYSTINFKAFQAFAYNNPIRSKYSNDSFDCDDYAIVFLGRAREAYGKLARSSACCIGILAGDLRDFAHAVVWFIDDNKQIYIYDPRTEKIETLSSAWKVDTIIV